jgi:hypothetical protein
MEFHVKVGNATLTRRTLPGVADTRKKKKPRKPERPTKAAAAAVAEPAPPGWWLPPQTRTGEVPRTMERRMADAGCDVVMSSPAAWFHLRKSRPAAVAVDTEGVQMVPPLLTGRSARYVAAD